MEGRGFKKYLKANEKKGGALLQCIYEGTFLDGKKNFPTSETFRLRVS